jgi:phosphinothricin acetyltransferase
MRLVSSHPWLIEAMTAADWPAVQAIYASGIATGDATFERETPDWAHFDGSHRAEGRFVARESHGGPVLGWTALSPYSGRRVYAGVAWESVYVAPAAQGRGVGRALLLAQVEASEAAGVWTLLAGIIADNAASLAVHAGVGFRQVGVNVAIGQDAAGRWRDVVLMERRSATIGR